MELLNVKDQSKNMLKEIYSEITWGGGGGKRDRDRINI